MEIFLRRDVTWNASTKHRWPSGYAETKEKSDAVKHLGPQKLSDNECVAVHEVHTPTPSVFGERGATMV